jgi:GNAT superfamily N-acetyltransferase
VILSIVMEHRILQYRLEQGALEVEFMEEMFNEFRGRKTAAEIIQRLQDREHLILISLGPSLEDPAVDLPVAFKVGHELRPDETNLQLADLVSRLGDSVKFSGRKIFYSWIGGTRAEWRGQGHYRALTEQQEEWAHRHDYDELVVKTKNKFYTMRATLDHLRFDVIKFEPHRTDRTESKVYMSKPLSSDTLRQHLTSRSIMEAA